MRKIALSLALVVVIAASSASAAVLVQNDFNDGTNQGWYAGGEVITTPGPDGTSYYLQGSRDNYYPYMYPTFVKGDVPALLGGITEFTVSIDARLVDVPWSGAGYAWNLMTTDVTSQWRYDHGGIGGAWTTYSLDINTNWSDAEAVAAGWERIAGTESFTEAWANVHVVNMFNSIGNTGGAPGAYTVGVDNFVVTGEVPEPATMALLAAGGVFGLIRRKRK